MISNVSKLFRKLYVRKKQGKFVKGTCQGVHFLKEDEAGRFVTLLKYSSFIGTLQEFPSCLIKHLKPQKMAADDNDK